MLNILSGTRQCFVIVCMYEKCIIIEAYLLVLVVLISDSCLSKFYFSIKSKCECNVLFRGLSVFRKLVAVPVVHFKRYAHETHTVNGS